MYVAEQDDKPDLVCAQCYHLKYIAIVSFRMSLNVNTKYKITKFSYKMYILN